VVGHGRAARRAAERDLDKLARDRAKLAALEPGGSAERPIEVASASLVEIEARTARCTRCDGAMRVEEHVVERSGQGLLRVARVACPLCGTRRDVWFRIAEPS
jgi:hypothetical protein